MIFITCVIALAPPLHRGPAGTYPPEDIHLSMSRLPKVLSLHRPVFINIRNTGSKKATVYVELFEAVYRGSGDKGLRDTPEVTADILGTTQSGELRSITVAAHGSARIVWLPLRHRKDYRLIKGHHYFLGYSDISAESLGGPYYTSNEFEFK
jgi:hypothetical protein